MVISTPCVTFEYIYESKVHMKKATMGVGLDLGGDSNAGGNKVCYLN